MKSRFQFPITLIPLLLVLFLATPAFAQNDGYNQNEPDYNNEDGYKIYQKDRKPGNDGEKDSFEGYIKKKPQQNVMPGNATGFKSKFIKLNKLIREAASNLNMTWNREAFKFFKMARMARAEAKRSFLERDLEKASDMVTKGMTSIYKCLNFYKVEDSPKEIPQPEEKPTPQPVPSFTWDKEGVKSQLLKVQRYVLKAKSKILKEENPTAKESIGKAVSVLKDAIKQFRAEKLKASIALANVASTFAKAALILAGIDTTQKAPMVDITPSAPVPPKKDGLIEPYEPEVPKITQKKKEPAEPKDKDGDEDQPKKEKAPVISVPKDVGDLPRKPAKEKNDPVKNFIEEEE